VAGGYYEGGEGPGGQQSGGGGAQGLSDGAGDGFAGLAGGILDPESLYQIALLYERLGDNNECAAYMELVLAQETGPAGSSGGAAGDEFGGLAGVGESSQDSFEGAKGADGAAHHGGGVGVTVTTSKARLWLAKWLFFTVDYARASELANELCQDGVEVEEAKALIRDIRSRLDSERAERSARSSE